MRLLFAGTPDVAVTSLRALVASSHAVAAVLTRPDAPAGRGRKLAPSPVASAAEELGIPILKAASLKDPEVLDAIANVRPDACPVVAYGALIPAPALDIPEHGWINLHFSLLPAWRGAAPVQHAIWYGDTVTGATTFRIDRGLDTGPTFGCVTHPIDPRITAGELLGDLAPVGAELLVRTLDGIADGRIVAREQSSDGVSLAPKISPDMAQVNWRHPGLAIDRMVRACTPAPGAWTTLRGERVKLEPVTLEPTWPDASGHAPPPPGEILVTKHHVLVGTATDPVALSRVKPPGKPWMVAADWARGARLASGERCE